MKGWKTIVFNILMGILLVIDQQGVNWGLSIEKIAAIGTVGNFILRFITTTPIGITKK
jgi:hypothetical protein